MDERRNGDWVYSQGLHQMSPSCHAFLQPGGGWGLANAGLIVDHGMTMLVDTLFDIPRTRAMLDHMADRVPAAKKIDFVTNTHAHGDHSHGNSLLAGSHILVSARSAHEMAERKPEAWYDMVTSMEGDAARMFAELAVPFSFKGVSYIAPSQTFEREHRLKIGERQVELYEFGPVHTKSDVVVRLPEEGVVFAGDLMFSDCHVPINYPNIAEWIRACETMLAWGDEIFVPGHGRVCDRKEVQRHLDYLLFTRDETRKCYDRGLSVVEAADELFTTLGRFSYLLRADLIFRNTKVLYSEFSGVPLNDSYATVFAERWRYRNKIRGRAPGIEKLPGSA